MLFPLLLLLFPLSAKGQPGCRDSHQFCEFWASQGECERNPQWMPFNCRLSCNSCNAAPQCADLDFECGAFARAGECRVNPVWMRPNCPLSCGICQATSGRQPSSQPQRRAVPAASQSTSECRDFDFECPRFARIGECRRNPVWMLPNCPLSCGRCSSAVQEPVTRRVTQPRVAPQPVTQAPRQGFATRAPSVPFTQTGVGTNDVNKCSSLRQSESTIQETLLRDNLVIPFEDTSTHQTLSLTQVRSSNGQFGCVPTLGGRVDCFANMCYHLRFRTMDGTCNNFDNPLWGASFHAFRRLAPAQYDDDVMAPLGSIRGGRPSPRDASRFLLSSPQVVTNNRFNALLMQWGQFLSHDITKTTMLPNNECRNCGTPPESPCLAINVSPFDPNSRVFGCQGSQIGQICCVRTARSSPVCGTGTSGNQRQQFNENTAFIDASLIYGSSVTDMARFRNGNTGFMRVEFANRLPVMPFDRSTCQNEANCNTVNFEAGDDRANLFLGLAMMHTIFLREHNRIVNALQSLNPSWNGDRLYQEARKIVGAEMQAITYKEYLPRLLGDAEFGRRIGAYFGYQPSTEPNIANVFSSAAFRFGHGMVNEFFTRLDENGQTIPQGGFSFLDGVFNSKKLVQEGGIDPIIRGMAVTPAKRPHRITTSMTERLFGNIDLAAVNIERAREHGIPGYGHWRTFCGMPRANSFLDLADVMLDQTVRDNLANSYSHPDNVDLYVAQLLEDPVADGMVGPTLGCLIGEQFKRLRDGDRFWYQNPAMFTPAQLAELERVSLSRLFCDNGDSLRRVQRSAFDLNQVSGFVDCSSIPSMNLEPWRE